MCTLTVVPVTGTASGGGAAVDARGFRLAFNRDELRTRAKALPPRITECEGGRAVMPIDPQGGGTWIAAGDTGIVLALLNVNPSSAGRPSSKPSGMQRSSRGLIIPHLLELDDRQAMVRAACELRANEYAPFRLVIVDEREVDEIRSDGRSITATTTAYGRRPAFFTSSGLGDALVEGPRRALFDEAFTNSSNWLEEQRRFHRHVWPDRRHVSVCMSREDALTVSHTAVEVSERTVTMTYHDGPPDADGREFVVELTRRNQPGR